MSKKYNNFPCCLNIYSESLGLFFWCVLAYMSAGHFKVEVTLRPFDWVEIYCHVEMSVGCG